MSAYERISATAEPAAIVAAVRAELAGRAITEYAVVDHGHDMAVAGSPGHVAWTLVFGSPAGGARLLDRDPAAAVDIPLRLAVIGAPGGGSEIVIRDMASLLAPDLAELASAFTALLREIAAAVSARA